MPPICPVDRAAMLPDADGVYRCRKDRRHEFRVMEERPRQADSYGPYCPSNMSCPACQAEMRPVPGEPGVWICTADAAHILELNPRLVCVPPAPEELMRDNPWVNRGAVAGPTTHWLAHLGITAPLLPPPQANGEDGAFCQFLGSIKRGGSKTGRRRRKKPQKRINDRFALYSA